MVAPVFDAVVTAAWPTPARPLIVSDARLLDTLTADPHNGGPWVMWKGTPYAHIMIPTAPRSD